MHNNTVMENLMRKSLNPEEGTANSVFLKHKNQAQGGGDAASNILVPRDFMIKTAYVRKRRNTTAQGKDADTQSVRSRQSSAITVFTKQSAAQN